LAGFGQHRDVDLVPARQRLGKNVALDGGGQLHLALHGLLGQRLLVQPRVLQGDGDLVGEERQQAQLVRFERGDAAVARLAVGRGEDADDRVVAFDGHGDRHAVVEAHRVASGGNVAEQFVADLHLAEGAVGLNESPSRSSSTARRALMSEIMRKRTSSASSSMFSVAAMDRPMSYSDSSSRAGT